MSSDELNWITQWLFDHAPIKSGDERIRILQFNTINEAYKNYELVTSQKTEFPIRSKTFLLKWIHSLKIRLPVFNKYFCPICAHGDIVRLLNASHSLIH